MIRTYMRAERRAVTRLRPLCVMAAAVLVLLLAAASPSGAAANEPCQVGAYRLADGRNIDVGPGADGHLRWRQEDGVTGELTRISDDKWTSTLGWTKRPDGKQVSFDCAGHAINFAGTAGKRIAFDVTETRFVGAGGVELAGRLVMPKGGGKVPIVVLVHGSEDTSARDRFALQRQFPSAGIGAFVYDKRGTGGSSGRYTQSYLILANDAIAAVHEARRLAAARAGRIGFQGSSQGGWVVPLAARIEPVDFAIIGYGLAVSPLEEDREAIALNMSNRGYGLDVVAKAMEVADATAEVLLSGFREGYDKVEAIKRKYGAEPWFRYVRGDVTFAILEKDPVELRKIGPVLFAGVPLQYDPMPVLRNLGVPQLWVLGADDIDAPSAETARRLQTLISAGRPITLAIVPHAEHGIYLFEIRSDGTREDTRQPEGYFRMMRNFIRNGRISEGYGAARVFPGGVRRSRLPVRKLSTRRYSASHPT